jgi:hypothetical protein
MTFLSRQALEGHYPGSPASKVRQRHSKFGRERDPRRTYNFGDITAAAGALQASLVAVPLVSAGMAVNDLTTGACVEMSLSTSSEIHLVSPTCSLR